MPWVRDGAAELITDKPRARRVNVEALIDKLQLLMRWEPIPFAIKVASAVDEAAQEGILILRQPAWRGGLVERLVAEATIRAVGSPQTNVPNGIVDENVIRKVRSRGRCPANQR